MFSGLSDKLVGTFQKLKGRGRITESNIEEAVREIRLSLLEADVHFRVVKSFIDNVRVKALGQEVLRNINAGQQFTKIVHDELVVLLGGTEPSSIQLKGSPSVVYMVGLQGSGKTTTSGKLALWIRKKYSKKPGLVPADIYRPAAIDQLKTLAKQLSVPVFDSHAGLTTFEIIQQAKVWAQEQMIEVVIIDTAGRTQLDSQMMNELKELKQSWEPRETLLVADAMLGQQAVEVAKGFHEAIELTGLVLTKVDGDARGGAALSIRQVTGVPIKFFGVGEKMSDIEEFHADRLAQRILDMGDVLSLVEKAQQVMDEKQARQAAEKMAKNKFTVDDFLSQIQMLKKMGGMGNLLKMLPGSGQLMKQMKSMTPPDQEIKRIEAIISSMTLSERRNHKILSGSRRLRIARGSGTQVSDINKFIRQFEQSQKMMSQMMKGGLGKQGLGGMKFPF